jgi:hypothetical protein
MALKTEGTHDSSDSGLKGLFPFSRLLAPLAGILPPIFGLFSPSLIS